MASPARPTPVWRKAALDAVATAAGADHRADPVLPVSGGPAGNARITAWIGLLLLPAFLAELFTLISLGQLLNVHILLGAALIPLVIAKTATTGWRIVRYYQGDPAYRSAGPPPMVLRLLGPLVVLSGLAVLGTGLALIPLGSATFTNIVTIVGFRINALTLHQAAFAVWAAFTALHVLARTVPALQLVGAGSGRSRLPGSPARGLTLAALVVVCAGVGILVLHLAGDWTHGSLRHHHHDRPSAGLQCGCGTMRM